MAFISMGSTPAVWDASTTNSSPRSLQNAPRAVRSLAFPVRLEAWVQTRALVFSFTSPESSSVRSLPFASQGQNDTSIPAFSSRYNGRSTELCSMTVEITWSPGPKRPRIAVFSASVELQVKATCLGFPSPTSSEILSLVP